MAFEYHLMAVNDETLEYAQQSGVVLPESVPAGRLPSLEELIAVAEAIPDHHIADLNASRGEFTLESDARVPMAPTPPFKQTSAAASFLQISAGPMGADEKYRVFFHGDADLMVRILQALSRQCGGLMFLEQSDCLPWFVLPGIDSPIGPESWMEANGT